MKRRKSWTGIRVEPFFFKTHQTIIVCWTWGLWLKGSACQEFFGKERGKNLSNTSKRRWIQYKILKNTCPVRWKIFFERTASIISWRKIIFFRKPQSPKLRNLRFIAIAKNLSTTLLLGKFFRLFWSNYNLMMRVCMFATRIRIKIGFSWKKSDSKMKIDAQDSISIMRFYCYCWNKGAYILQIVVVRSLVNTPSS